MMMFNKSLIGTLILAISIMTPSQNVLNEDSYNDLIYLLIYCILFIATFKNILLIAVKIPEN